MKILFHLLSAIYISVSLTSVCKAEANTTGEYIKTIIEQKFADKNMVVGVSIVFYEKSKASFYNYGRANKDINELVTSEHIFEIGSITKTFTTAILAELVNKGVVDLNDPVAQYLPETIMMPQRHGKQISLLDLATHHSGLPRNPTNMPLKDLGNPFKHYSVHDMYDFLNGYKLSRDIGEKFEYSNIGMGLLGHVLSLKTGKKYSELVHDFIFKPLKMTSSFIDVPPTHQAMIASGYNTDLSYLDHWQMPTLAGAGAIKSSAMDMLVYLKANLINDSPIDQALKLSHEIYDDTPEAGAKIGLAWNLKTSGETSYYWHNGQIGGFHAFIGFNKLTDKGLVILANSRHDFDPIGHSYLNGTLKQLAFLNSNKEVELSIETLVQLKGEYEIGPNFSIKVSVEKGQLYVQATNQPRFPIFAISKTRFFLKVVEADIEFEVDEVGNGVALTLIQNNQVIKGQRQPLISTNPNVQ